jgi:hypothetical protein
VATAAANRSTKTNDRTITTMAIAQISHHCKKICAPSYSIQFNLNAFLNAYFLFFYLN